ncbi:hypothetical protein [Microbacterium sp. CH12i]|uniref:hypothetical protein n=1 Tax=Microbacterium sp. CH12i TaxID=1479651 RepID=UPI000AE31BFE
MLLLIPLDQGEERSIRIVSARVGEQCVRRRVGNDAAGPHQQQPVTAQRLVHDVARDQQRHSMLCQAAEKSP